MARINVEILGDSRSLEKAFARSARSAKHFNNEVSGLSRGSLAASGAFGTLSRRLAFASTSFLSGAALTAGIKSSVTAADDLEEQISKTNVVFGKSAQAVEEWAKSLAQSFGLSEREALTLASTFGALFAPLGIVGKQAADQSEKLTQLGADLASFYNTDVQSALDAIQSGLVGQSRPLRAYGILLSAARVQQEALVETGKKHAANLTNQELVLARINLIYKDSKNAQGDFARTSGHLAQQTKILKANIQNLQAQIGAGLIPVLNKAATAANDFFQALSGGPAETPLRGQGVETTLVPTLAKRIAAYKKAGLSGKQILGLLRKQLGDAHKENEDVARLRKLGLIKGPFTPDVSPRADELISEAFAFARDKALRDRLRRQREADKTTGDGADTISPGRRRANEAARAAAVDRAAFRVEQTQLTKGLADDIAANQKLNQLLLRRIKGTHSTLALQRQQLQVQLTINDLLRQQADARKAAAQAARQAAFDARQARQFRELGLDATGQPLAPGAKALARELQRVSSRPLDKAARATVDRIRRTMRDNFGSLTKDVRTQIKQMLDAIDSAFRQHKGIDVTRFQKTARGQFVLAGAHPTGGVTINGGVHLHGVQNVKQLENELAKRNRQRAHARRSTR
jgi:hypothetical protein